MAQVLHGIKCATGKTASLASISTHTSCACVRVFNADMQSFCQSWDTSQGEACAFRQYFAVPSFDLDRIVRTPFSSAQVAISTRSCSDTSSLEAIPEDRAQASFSSTYCLSSSQRNGIDQDTLVEIHKIPRKIRRAPRLSVIHTRRLDLIRSAYAEAMVLILQDARSSIRRILDLKLSGFNSCYAFESFEAEFPTYARPILLTEALVRMLSEVPQAFAAQRVASSTQRRLDAELVHLRRQTLVGRPDMLVSIEPSVDNVIVSIGIDVLYGVWSKAIASPLLPVTAWSRFLFSHSEDVERSACDLGHMLAFQKLVRMKLNELFLRWIHDSQPPDESDFASYCESSFDDER